MTQDEFEDWMTEHCARFAGIDRLRRDAPGIAKDYWHHLHRYDFEEAMAATREIMAMDPQPFPAEHLGKLAAICKAGRFRKHEQRQQPYRQSETYRCAICRDTGAIAVFHPVSYQPIIDESFDRTRHLKEIVVACNCGSGQRHSNKSPESMKSRLSLPNMLRFDERRMLPVIDIETGCYRDELDLVEFVQNMKPKNFNEEFAAFG